MCFLTDTAKSINPTNPPAKRKCTNPSTTYTSHSNPPAQRPPGNVIYHTIFLVTYVHVMDKVTAVTSGVDGFIYVLEDHVIQVIAFA